MSGDNHNRPDQPQGQGEGGGWNEGRRHEYDERQRGARPASGRPTEAEGYGEGYRQHGPGQVGTRQGGYAQDRVGEGGYGQGGFGGQNLGGRGGQQGDDHRTGRDPSRGMWDRATDEMSSWFGDEDAERRRRRDAAEEGAHRGRGPKGYSRSDERIREDVCDRLSDDPRVDASGIEVEVANAEVTLTGEVGDRNQRRRAEECVEAISGVNYVQNNLRVRPSAGAGLNLGGSIPS